MLRATFPHVSAAVITLKLNPDSSEIPRELWDIQSPPAQLWIRGRESAFALLKRLPRDGLAVVGTRRPQVRSQLALQGWVRELAGYPLIVVSGFARGIDAIAHEGALKAKLPTVAVMATGLDRLYPPEHASMANEILDAGGLLVSERELDEPGRPGYFIQRNRIIAAWTKATWVVEAPARSGALNTARWARDHHRVCFSVPAFPGDLAMAGNQRLLEEECAVPFWNVHSLGLVWVELAAHCPPASSRTLPRSDADIVVALARNLCFETGGATFESLLGAALDRSWEAGRFFLALQQAIKQGRLHEEAGILAPYDALG
jgi:DNA protecting protein DprA